MLEHASTRLQNYPSLNSWYERSRNFRLATASPAEAFAWRLCGALQHEGHKLVDICVHAFSVFDGEAMDPVQDFLATDGFFQSHDAPLLEILGQIAETSIQEDLGLKFQNVMVVQADKTGLVVFRFLAAWTALNSGMHELCIKECEKVVEPYGSIFTLHGQALLETGQAKEAIEVLNIAVKLSPDEILAWFQLAKAHHVNNAPDAAWNALRHCRRLAPQSAEVALFLGRVALEPGATQSQQLEAFQAARPYFELLRQNCVVACTGFRLACSLKDRALLDEVIAKADWGSFLKDRLFLSELPEMLRRLQALGWHDVAHQWLSLITPKV